MREAATRRFRSLAMVPRRSPDALAWLPWAWLTLFFISNVKATSRDAQAALTGSASADNLVELAVYGLIAAGCLATLLRRRGHFRRSAGLVMLTAYGALAVTSAAWSSVPLFSVVRGSQIGVIALLAVVSVEAWRSGRRDVVSDWMRIWLGFTLAVTGLLTLGIFVGTSESRFAWPGTHPIVVGSYLALAAVVALSMLLERGWRLRASQLRLTMVLTVVFIVFIIINSTRSTLAAFVIGTVAVYITRSARRRDLRWLMVPLAGLVGTIAAMLYSDSLVSFVLRGQTVEEFATLSDRTALWSVAWERASDHILLGSGYGAGRGMFLEMFPWAGTAHSLWAELIVDLGIVGAALGLGLLAWSMWNSISLQLKAPGPIGSTSLGVMLVTAVAALAEVGFAFPGLFLTTLALVIAALTAARSRAYSELFDRDDATTRTSRH